MERFTKGYLILSGILLIFLLLRAIGIELDLNVSISDLLVLFATIFAAMSAYWNFKEAKASRLLNVRQELHNVAINASTCESLLVEFGSNPALDEFQRQVFITKTAEIESKKYVAPKSLHKQFDEALKHKFLIYNYSVRVDNFYLGKATENYSKDDIAHNIRLDWLYENRMREYKKFQQLKEAVIDYLELISDKNTL